jgi:ketosteroid isomerase-like protein
VAESNSDVVRRMYERWHEGDIEGALGLVDAEAEIDWSNSRAPFAGVYRGHEAVRRFWQEILDAWEAFSPTIDQVLELGPGRVVAVTTVSGRGRGTGIELSARGAVLWTVRGGRIVRGVLFQDKDDALRAAASST